MGRFQRVQHVSVPMPRGGNDAARAFYGRTLGLQEVQPPATLDTAALVWFQVGDEGHEIHVFTNERLGPNSPDQHLCLQVDDIAAARQQLTERAIPIEETTPIHNRPRFFIRDPFGNRIEITQITGNFA